ncbi:DUF397 domain-containing protein [Streptomyces californicus]|uniref:DUF397 domain-containing protein n=1 Tax=Streptomyces californicus TaxID=67351 RepID=UPI00296F728A|nr:DUF397 domain-containing protein [Streptomyces californicus]MDW4912252.1 DUF397 domain-containing protein [Streptomyces californicus]
MNGNAALTGADWFTSSYSNGQGGECVEGARLGGTMMAVRDSKNREGGVSIFLGASWAAFVEALKKDALV